MTKTEYKTLHQMIRANGLAYATRMCAQAGDVVRTGVCDKLFVIGRTTDWLAMRERWQSNRYDGTSAASVIRLTTPFFNR